MKWIAVENRLPIEHQLEDSSQTRGLWVLDINEFPMLAYYDFVTEAWREIRHGESLPIFNKITHWMPVLVLPKKGV